MIRTAILVVDMLRDFVDGALANPAAKAIVGPIGELVGRVREQREFLVVYANDAHHLSDPELRLFPPHAVAGTPGATVIDDLRPADGDAVVEKRFYSAFSATRLDALLRARDVGRVVVVGQRTDCSVRHTGYDAFAHGYELVVCPDATAVHGDRDDDLAYGERQSRALEYLHDYYGARLEMAPTVG